MSEWIDLIISVLGMFTTVAVGVCGYLYGRYGDHEVRIVRLEVKSENDGSMLKEIRADVKHVLDVIAKANL